MQLCSGAPPSLTCKSSTVLFLLFRPSRSHCFLVKIEVILNETTLTLCLWFVNSCGDIWSVWPEDIMKASRAPGRLCRKQTALTDIRQCFTQFCFTHKKPYNICLWSPKRQILTVFRAALSDSLAVVKHSMWITIFDANIFTKLHGLI